MNFLNNLIQQQTTRDPSSLTVLVWVNELANEEELQPYLHYPVVFYLVKASPFQKKTFVNLPLLSEKVVGKFCTNPLHSQLGPLSLSQIMNAERIIITEYTSISHIEERLMCEEPDNTAIAMIVDTFLELFSEADCMDVPHLCKLLLLYPQEEGSSSVFSPFASYISQRDLFDSFQMAGLSDALSSM